MKRPTAWFRRLLDLAELAGDIDQQDIAQRIGVSKSAITSWKEGTEPRIDAVRSATKAYKEFVDTDTDELFNELLHAAYPLNKGDDPKGAKKKRPKGPHPRAGAVYRSEGVRRGLFAINGLL